LETRFLLNEAAMDLGIPLIYGGAIATYGMVLTIRSPETACFRCFNPNAPPPGSLPTCETAGIFNAVSAQVGAIQAGEAIRILVGQAPSGDLIVIDGWRPEIQRIHLARRPDCAACGRGERDYLGARRSQVLASLCGSDTISLDPIHSGTIDLDGLGRRLEALGSARRAGGVLLVDVEGRRLTVFADGRALIRGVKDETAHGTARRRPRGPRTRGRAGDRREPRASVEPDPGEPPGDRCGRAASGAASPDWVRQAGSGGSRPGDRDLRGFQGARDLRPP